MGRSVSDRYGVKYSINDNTNTAITKYAWLYSIKLLVLLASQ
jgi:hypothetical protein